MGQIGHPDRVLGTIRGDNSKFQYALDKREEHEHSRDGGNIICFMFKYLKG